MLVDADNYLLELVKYIHRNPLRAGIVAKVGDYPWSSHREYAVPTNKGNWLYGYIKNLFCRFWGKIRHSS
jgi:hypothetical protein